MKLTPRQEYNLTKTAILIAIAFVSLMLVSCGSRKSQVNKTQKETTTKEQTNTATNEAISENVTTTIDTTINVPARTSSFTVPLPVDATPYVYEDDHIRSETSYDRNTGVLSNKVTSKGVGVAVKAKSITEREIKRETKQEQKREVKEKEKSNVKETERVNEWGKWIGIILGIAFVIWVIWLFFVKRKRQTPDNNNKNDVV